MRLTWKPLLLLLISFSVIAYFASFTYESSFHAQRELLEYESKNIEQTVTAELLTDEVPSQTHVIIDLNSNLIQVDKSIKIAVGQYPSAKPYSFTIEELSNARNQEPQKQVSSVDYLTNDDFEVFPKRAWCDPSEKEKQRKLSRMGDGHNFSPSSIELMNLLVCDWDQYQGVKQDKFNSTGLQFETVSNVFRSPGIHFYSVDEVTHRASYPPPNLAGDILHNLTAREQICNVLDSSKWLFCCKKYWSQVEKDGETSYDYFQIGIQQPCAEKIFVAGFPCAIVDWNSVHHDVPGTIFVPPTYQQEKGSQFLLQPWTKPVGLNKTANVKYYDRIATVLEVYSDRPGHFAPEVLPWVVYLVLTLPQDIPILLMRTSLTEKFLQVLVDAKLTSMERFVRFQRETVYAAREVIKVQNWPNCASDANFLPSEEMAGLVRRIYAPEISYEKKNGIAIIHRADSSSRVVSNNAELVENSTRFPRNSRDCVHLQSALSARSHQVI